MGQGVSATRRRGRPLSPEAQAFLAHCDGVAAPARGVAAALLISRSHAELLASRLTSRGYLLPAGTVETPGRGPVIAYIRNPEIET